jgi:hypothetical protein
MFVITGITGNVGVKWLATFWPLGDPFAQWCETSAKAKPGQNSAVTSWARIAFGVDFHQRTPESCRTENQTATSDRITVDTAFLE